MKFMGSKRRLANHILPIMLSERAADQWWVEPFVGGGNMIERVDGKRIGADANPYVIDALVAIRDEVNDLPKNSNEFTEESYNLLRDGDYKYKGYVGFALSYGGKWLGGWRRDNLGKRDYVAEAYRGAIKQSPKLKGVRLVCCDYSHLDIPPRSIIYCDPPYADTTKYNVDFDHEMFWNWCRAMVRGGHTVFVSEYDAPDDFFCVWEASFHSSLTKNTGGKYGVEKLFELRK